MTTHVMPFVSAELKMKILTQSGEKGRPPRETLIGSWTLYLGHRRPNSKPLQFEEQTETERRSERGQECSDWCSHNAIGNQPVILGGIPPSGMMTRRPTSLHWPFHAAEIKGVVSDALECQWILKKCSAWVGFEVGKEGCSTPPHTLIFEHR